ncbi:hypothetical protein BUALT_Bualt14G0005100 [Buddleja alternifolia]|uniref:Polygalacturonase n=1 Tax=Buddleja alternifolia TaxID=168488 RepID=A0AAV6WND9_9LAMI|nr:hypothetical protein BUALT_Bualt14G0005100 [Buddleja alternifolia]
MPKLISFSWKFFLALIAIQLFPTTAYNVVRFGARGDGKTDSTLAFQRAWKAACSSVRPSAVSVPRGTFLLRSISFTGPCRNRIVFQIAGTIVAPNNYQSLGNSEYWIQFYKSISFQWCSNVVVSGLRSFNSHRMHMSITRSNNIKIQKIRIIAPSGSPNTDGIHIENSRGITITSSTIRTGDDCISIGPGSMNLWISKIGCGPGHGISVGSLGNSMNEAGVQNVTVTNSVFTRTDNGVRLKSWARPSGGYARNLEFRNLIMRNVANPIIIDQQYCPQNRCPNQSSGVRVSQVTYKNIKGTSSTQAAMTFLCSKSNPCRGIRLQDIKLTYVNRLKRPTLAYCQNAAGYSNGAVSPRSCL